MSTPAALPCAGGFLPPAHDGGTLVTRFFSVGKILARSVQLPRPYPLLTYGESGGQSKNMAEMQADIKSPENLQKMQSPGEDRLMKFSGVAALVKGGFGVAPPNK